MDPFKCYTLSFQVFPLILIKVPLYYIIYENKVLISEECTGSSALHCKGFHWKSLCHTRCDFTPTHFIDWACMYRKCPVNAIPVKKCCFLITVLFWHNFHDLPSVQLLTETFIYPSHTLLLFFFCFKEIKMPVGSVYRPLSLICIDRPVSEVRFMVGGKYVRFTAPTDRGMLFYSSGSQDEAAMKQDD